MKKYSIVFLGLFIAGNVAQAAYLKVKLVADGVENQVHYTGTGNETRYEFTSASTLRIISKYNSSSTTGGKAIVCELRNVDQLSPIANVKLAKYLDTNTSSYMALECSQEVSASTEALPSTIDNLTVVVDIAKAPQNFKLSESNSSSDSFVSENSGYTTINTTVVPKEKIP